jgi:CRISPR-associated endoribonuclease Cas6
MARLKLKFSASNEVFNALLNKKVNGFINGLLGEGNEYHGKFSDYSVSSMQGAVWNDDDTFSFPNGGHIYVSSNNQNFINAIAIGLVSNKATEICGMKFVGYEVSDYNLYKKYDIVRTISPVLVSTTGRRMLTFRDDNFLDILREKSIKKLVLAGVDERKANSLKFELFHPENAKTVCAKIGDAVNIASRVMFIVSGNKEARNTLYNMGIGKCTGFGFGAVSVNNK